MSDDIKVTTKTYVPTDDWQDGKIAGTGPRWRLLEEKTLTERFNEAYDEDAKREDEAFFETTKAYYRHGLDSDEQALLDRAAEQLGHRLDDGN